MKHFILSFLISIPTVSSANAPHADTSGNPVKSGMILLFCGVPYGYLSSEVKKVPGVDKVFPQIDDLINAINQAGIVDKIETAPMFGVSCGEKKKL
jgi:hypothetical protein